MTTAGTLVPGLRRHYIRILPAAMGDAAPNEDPNAGVLMVANRAPGERADFPAKEIVDAGFLELVRYGIRRADEPLIVDSLRVVDAVLKVDTPLGPCWRRYNHDGYGDRPDGGPFLGWGRGRAWPLLTGERGHYELAAGRDASNFGRTLERFGGANAMLPEQVWDEDKPQLGMRLGKPTGAALPLMWAHAEYIQLLRSIADGQVFGRIAPVAERYLTRKGRRDLEIWKLNRQARSVGRGETLRVQAPGTFRLRWTQDEWLTHADTDAIASGIGIYFVDLVVGAEQRAPLRFTFFWTAQVDLPALKRPNQSWEGRDYAVAVR